MKKNIILSAFVILLCLAVIHILKTRDAVNVLNKEIVSQKEEIETLSMDLKNSEDDNEQLTLELRQSEQINKNRKTRIDQLVSCYPPGIWDCDSDANRIVFKQEITTPTIDNMISKLNELSESYDEPTIKFLRQAEDSVYVTVEDSGQLAERMGSAGANCYMGRVVYSITSIEGIEAVVFEFEEGSHAVPGKYSRNDFEP